MMESKRDLSITMARANVIVLFLSLPLFVVQFSIFVLSQEIEDIELTFNPALLTIAIILGIATHEIIHGLSWMVFGHKPLSAVKFGFQWKTLTPYAHLKEPVEVNVYRIGTFMPGFILGILPYGLSLLLNDGNLFWLGLVHTAGAGGDWLVLWLIRRVKSGTLVEDHPTHAGCYVIEP
ncbi:MAG: DUF3267 domain-containing protein [Anaerolineales bacterium]|nr:DUF3267 domain-containing protein [Anaerolineales bacterium]